MADYLTKAISPRTRWKQFFDFMNMDTKQKDEGLTDPGRLKVAIAAASAGIIGLHALRTTEGSGLAHVKTATMAALTGYVAMKVAELGGMHRDDGVKEEKGGTCLAVEDARSAGEPLNQNLIDQEQDRPRMKMMRFTSFTMQEPSGGIVGSGDGSLPPRFPGTPEPGLEDQSQRGQRRQNNVRVFTELATPRWIKKYPEHRGLNTINWF